MTQKNLAKVLQTQLELHPKAHVIVYLEDEHFSVPITDVSYDVKYDIITLTVLTARDRDE
jgi:hypothetical protein